MKKTINIDKLPVDFRRAVVLRHFLKNPKKFYKFFRLLWLSNVLSHMGDSVIQELNEFAPLMMDSGIAQRMKNANKAYEGLVNAMYKQTKDVLNYNDNNYMAVVDMAIYLQPFMETIINDICFDGKDNWKWREITKAVDKVLPENVKEQYLNEFIQSLEKDYAKEYADMEQDEKRMSPEAKEMWRLAEMYLTRNSK